MDLLILPTKKSNCIWKCRQYSNFTSPMKLFDYLSSSKPIIASSLSVLKEVLVNKKNCIFIDELNVYKWKLTINKFY